ncbi:MAG TPA: GNAT family N-acetyltransferase [Spirochaetales bacterium]|nr:GNAT family N-acetyltransferase [Spirochaetales bacterium]HPM72986.1 GNAT family N-acetyltransferase [Spirochaetales bacterium]
MAVLLPAGGSAFPVLGGSYEGGGDDAAEALGGLIRSRAVRTYRPAACVGASDHVAALEAALGWRPALEVEYDAMRLLPEARPAGGRRLDGGRRLAAHGFRSGPAEIRRAGPDDLDALYPIAAAYEQAEVMTELHAFDPEACRAAQARSLASQLVYIAIVGGRPVARAQTNARGLATDQIGGVYVEPERRGLGLGRLVVEALVAAILSDGRAASLFVKKTNAIARSLYLSMGFACARDYRVSYFA